MTHRLLIAAALAAVCLAGCSSLPGGGGLDQAALKTILDHAETCERHYHGQTVPPSLSVQIDCAARPAPAAP